MEEQCLTPVPPFFERNETDYVDGLYFLLYTIVGQLNCARRLRPPDILFWGELQKVRRPPLIVPVKSRPEA